MSEFWWDREVPGLGTRRTPNGTRAWVFQYRIDGRTRRMTLARCADMTLAQARNKARTLRAQVDDGGDPAQAKVKAREQRKARAVTVADLAARFLEEHSSKKRTGGTDEIMLRVHVLPVLGKKRVEDVRFADVDRLHRAIVKKGTPIIANRVHSMCTKMFGLAIRWGMRTDNPATGVMRAPENKRRRYMTRDEQARLLAAVSSFERPEVGQAIKLLLLTGARRGEVLNATWSQFDLAAGRWTKPAHLTKQKRMHQVRLSAPAVALLTEMKAAGGERLFPADLKLRRGWATICKRAGIEDLHLHDLRHCFASFGISAGLTLPMIGELLGHSSPVTTHRYAHLVDDMQQEAVDKIGALIVGGESAEVVRLRR